MRFDIKKNKNKKGFDSINKVTSTLTPKYNLILKRKNFFNLFSRLFMKFNKAYIT